jgi:hypothetical protein
MRILIEVGMRLTGHKSREAYIKYDINVEGIQERDL